MSETIIKLKYITNFTSGVGFPEDLQGSASGDIPFMKVSDINSHQKTVESAVNYVSIKTIAEKGWRPIQPGAILMAKIGAALAKNHRKVLLSQAMIDNNMLAAVPYNVDKNYYYWLWQTIDLTDHQNISSVPSVNMESLKNAKVRLPDISIQPVISEKLKNKTTIIDKMITAKNHTHTQLSELRTAIITDAVRFGGTVMNTPKVRLKSIVRVFNGATPKSDIPEFWNGDVAWATPVDLSGLSDKFLGATQRTITEKGYLSCNTKVIEPGNIVISNRAPIGLVAINNIPVCTNQGCKVLVLNKEKIDVTYLYYYLSVITDDLQNLGTGTTFMEISSETLKNIEIPLPSLDEQRNIAKTLDRRIAKLDNANMRLSSSISLLEEYRTSLISNVITGKVGV